MATKEQVSEARSRGGKPSDANRIKGRTAAMDVYDKPGQKGAARASDGSTVEQGPNGEIYRYNPKYDYTTIERDGNISAPKKGNHLPGGDGGINNYIDKVLEMSGMQGGGQGGAGADVPVPTPRPSGMTGTENNPGKLADDTIAPPPVPGDSGPQDEGAPDDGTLQDILLGTAIAGAGGYAGYKMFGGNKGGSPVDEMIDQVDGGNVPERAAPVQDALPAPEARAAVAGPAPQQALPAPPPASAVDQSIEAIDGPPEQSALPPPPKQLTDADAPYSPRNPAPPTPAITDADAPYSPRNPSPSVAASTAPTSRAELFQQMQGKSVQQIAQMLRASGIDMNNLAPEEIRALAEASNVARAGRQAASQAVESAVRGATR